LGSVAGRLIALLERVARDYPTGDLYVTENGSSYDDHLAPTAR
jgi:beta-glucosidase